MCDCTDNKGWVEYSSNNSGGYWWLTDEDWKNLEKAGWEVDWEEGRRMRALATSAKRYGVSLRVAMAEFEDVTGQSPFDQGCNCCGKPHEFYAYDSEGNMIW